MNKKRLIELLKDVPDDAPIHVQDQDGVMFETEDTLTKTDWTDAQGNHVYVLSLDSLV